MSISKQDFLTIAQSKVSENNTEIELRCIISRSYYAAYHHALEFHESLLVKGFIPTKPTGVHATLIYQLLNPSIPRTDPDFIKSLDIGNSLRGLYPFRKQADYKMGETVLRVDMKSVIAQTVKMLSK